MTFEIARPIHPGEYLREEYLIPLGLSAGALARRLYLPRTRIERLIREETGVTPDTAMRLARFFATTPEFWLNYQQAYELAVETSRPRKDIDAIEPFAA